MGGRGPYDDAAAGRVRESGRAIVIDGDNRVLLLYGAIQESPPRNAWYMPGGRLEAGESPEDAVIRDWQRKLG